MTSHANMVLGAGYPEHVAVIGDFVLVIEDKAALDKHVNLTNKGVIDTEVKSVTDYAVNGAYFYGKHVAQNSAFKKVFAVGVSGDEKHHKITPLWVDDREGYKLMNAIKMRLDRSNVGSDAKKDKLLAELAILQTSFRLNEVNETLGKTPLKFYTEFLYEHVFKNIKYQKTSENFIGRFYGEFMSYSGGDGQTLGIILTPRHITDLMCDLVDIQPDDVVLDPTCGFRVIIMTQANSQVNTRGLELLPKFKIKKMNRWCAV